MKKLIRFMSMGILLGVVFSLMSSVLAAGGSSDYTEKTVYGYDYRYESYVSNNTSGQIFGQASVSCTNVDELPIGYMGAQARIYNTSGILKASSSWRYNETDNPLVITITTYDTTSGYYYCKGQVKLYNGDGYSTYSCKATPNYAPTRNGIEIQRNENGEIYGSELFLSEVGIQPDLILAEGNGGQVGYIRAIDLDAKDVTTPEQAIEYEKNGLYSIPLYESDGKTIIGTFYVS